MNKVEFNVKNINRKIEEKKQFGDEHIRVTNQCFYKDGKPWLPCAGECHFSRIPEEDWDKTLSLMKEGGLSIVSTYVFWIHHEEIKGEFTFEGRCNLNKFIQKCAEHDLLVLLRPGPWAHGECRNGGFPDWLVKECYEACKDMDREWEHMDCDIDIGMRCLVEPYMSYAKEYMQRIMNEVKGNRNIIGIQIENELAKFPDYMSELKKIVVETGIKVPIYTATGWGKVKLNDDLIPSVGAYPDYGWDMGEEMNMADVADSGAYVFSSSAFVQAEIGADIQDKKSAEVPNVEDNVFDMPYITCELGGGIQTSYKRRPYILPEDVSAISLCTLGSNAALLGLYMYKGGLNPIGKTTYTQECKATGYPNEYPLISYDFQAPIGEVCQVRKHYFLLKNIFELCNNFGDMLAPMPAVLPDGIQKADCMDKASVRCSVRSNGESGFLFVNNHNRIQELSEKTDVCFTIATKSNTVEIPIKTILPGVHFAMPFNLEYGRLKAKYITAMPNKKGDNLLVFTKIKGIEPVLCTDSGEIIALDKLQTINGVDIVVKDEYEFKESVGKTLEATMLSENTKPTEWFEHLGVTDDTREYKFSVSEDATYVKINWMGNFAAVFDGDELVCDRYFDGDPWVIDAKKLKNREIVVKIQPLTKYDIETTYCNYKREEGHFVPSAEEFAVDVVYV